LIAHYRAHWQKEDGTFLCLGGAMIDLSGIDRELHKGVADLARQMRTHGYQRDDPVREIFALLGDRWTTLILLVLRIGRWRHAELRRALGRLGAEGKISQRVLTLKLRALERDGIATRHATPDVPPKVSYELSPLGESLVTQIETLLNWVHGNRETIDSARARFDAREVE
jgi:DNA-binding HxlR family transcriptional regulator